MRETTEWLRKNTRLADMLPYETGDTGLPLDKPEKDENGNLKPKKEMKLDSYDKMLLRAKDKEISPEMAKEIMNKYPSGLSHLGVGANGIATKLKDIAGKWMESGNLGKVVKITFDPSEAAVAKSQINDKLTSMVKIYSVDDIKSATKVPAWIIEAEEVIPLKGKEEELVSLIMSDIYGHKEAKDIEDGGKAFKDSYKHIINKSGIDSFYRRNAVELEDMGCNIKNVAYVWNRWTKMMDGLMKKWIPMDASGLNIGKRVNSEYVLLDLGME